MVNVIEIEGHVEAQTSGAQRNGPSMPDPAYVCGLDMHGHMVHGGLRLEYVVHGGPFHAVYDGSGDVFIPFPVTWRTWIGWNLAVRVLTGLYLEFCSECPL